jgi:hypothetical protein
MLPRRQLREQVGRSRAGEALGAVMARYEIEMDPESIAVIREREGLPAPPA